MNDVLLLVTECLGTTGVTVLIEGVCDLFLKFGWSGKFWRNGTFPVVFGFVKF